MVRIKIEYNRIYSLVILSLTKEAIVSQQGNAWPKVIAPMLISRPTQM